MICCVTSAKPLHLYGLQFSDVLNEDNANFTGEELGVNDLIFWSGNPASIDINREVFH